MTVGELLREFREREGYSQAALAERLRIQQSTVSKVETGVQSLPGSALGLFWALSEHTSTQARLERLMRKGRV